MRQELDVFGMPSESRAGTSERRLSGGRCQLSRMKNNLQHQNGLPHEGEFPSFPRKYAHGGALTPYQEGILLGLRAGPKGLWGPFRRRYQDSTFISEYSQTWKLPPPFWALPPPPSDLQKAWRKNVSHSPPR